MLSRTITIYGEIHCEGYIALVEFVSNLLFHCRWEEGGCISN